MLRNKVTKSNHPDSSSALRMTLRRPIHSVRPMPTAPGRRRHRGGQTCDQSGSGQPTTSNPKAAPPSAASNLRRAACRSSASGNAASAPSGSDALAQIAAMPAVDHRGVGLFEVDVVLRERVVVVHGRVVLGAVALRAGRRRPLARGLSRHAAPLRGSHSPRSGS